MTRGHYQTMDVDDLVEAIDELAEQLGVIQIALSKTFLLKTELNRAAKDWEDALEEQA